MRVLIHHENDNNKKNEREWRKSKKKNEKKIGVRAIFLEKAHGIISIFFRGKC